MVDIFVKLHKFMLKCYILEIDNIQIAENCLQQLQQVIFNAPPAQALYDNLFGALLPWMSATHEDATG